MLPVCQVSFAKPVPLSSMASGFRQGQFTHLAIREEEGDLHFVPFLQEVQVQLIHDSSILGVAQLATASVRLGGLLLGLLFPLPLPAFGGQHAHCRCERPPRGSTGGEGRIADEEADLRTVV